MLSENNMGYALDAESTQINLLAVEKKEDENKKK